MDTDINTKENVTKLIKTGNLHEYVNELLAKHKAVILDCEKILPYLTVPILKTSITKYIKKSQELVEALEKGYIPVTGINNWGYTRTDTKTKWGKKNVKEVLAVMPQEIKDVWEKVKKEGFFDSFSITTGGGDPLLVGNKGTRRYLLGAWLALAPGINMGFTIKK